MPFKILVADDRINDETYSLSELPALLRNAGYEVISTSDGVAVYDLVWEHNPDLVVLDIDFGSQPIDGIEICQAIRDEGSEIPIIIHDFHPQ
jgi:CheY-like chemotaxis protein